MSNHESYPAVLIHRTERTEGQENPRALLGDIGGANAEISDYPPDRAEALKVKMGPEGRIVMVKLGLSNGELAKRMISGIVGEERVQTICFTDADAASGILTGIDPSLSNLDITFAGGDLSDDLLNQTDASLENARAVILSGGPGSIHDPYHRGIQKFIERLLKQGVPIGAICMSYENLMAIYGRKEQTPVKERLLGEFILAPWEVAEGGKDHPLTREWRGKKMAVGAWNEFRVGPESEEMPWWLTPLILRKADKSPAVVEFAHEGIRVIGVQHHPELVIARTGVALLGEQKEVQFPDFKLTLGPELPRMLANVYAELAKDWEKMGPQGYGLTEDHLRIFMDPYHLPEKAMGRVFFGNLLEALIQQPH